MNRITAYTLAAIMACFAFGAHAETQKTSATAHFVVISQGDAFEMPNGDKGFYGGQSHATSIREDGTMASQWCTGEVGVNDAGEMTGGAGYCTIIEDNGDVIWVSYVNVAGQPGTWTVMGGTGAYEGATGGGTSTVVSQRADGQAWTGQSTGTITTK